MSKLVASWVAAYVVVVHTPLLEKVSDAWGPASLNRVEKDWCFGGFPTRLPLCTEAYVIYGRRAEESARARFPNITEGLRDPSDSMRNAMRHCVWASLLVGAFGEDTARGFLERHEADENGAESDTAADMRFNRVGIEIGRSTDDPSEDCESLIAKAQR